MHIAPLSIALSLSLLATNAAAQSTQPAPFDARQYQQRSTVLFGTGGAGVGALPGINPNFQLGATVAFTVRSLFGGFVLDAGMDVLFAPTCSYSCNFLTLQPSLRAGYAGPVSSRVALGIRGGYAPGLAFGRSYGAGLLHQLDADVHLTVVTARGALIEPYLGGGVLIAQPVLPVALVGLRIGAAL